jgi:ADP-heptose:LPS heptosyltransferase
MKILIIRFSSIGDIVLTTPVIRCLKKQIGAEIHFVTKKNFEKILLSNPYVDKVWSIEKEANEILPQLKLEGFDYIIDLHKNLRSFQIKWALKAPSFSFNKLNIEKWLMVNLKINRLPYTHIVDRNLETVASLGVKNDNEGLDYFIPKEDEIDLNELTRKHGFNIPDKKYIVLVIGAAHATKRLTVEKLIEICNKIELPIIILGGKDDMINSDLINSKSIGYALDLCGKLNLNQSASVVKQAYKVITHDTGLMHIAAAFRKDIISVWGNTIPELGMYPYIPEGVNSINEMIEVKDLSCRPCSKIGYDKCPKGHFKCMQMIDTDAVAEFVRD